MLEPLFFQMFQCYHLYLCIYNTLQLYLLKFYLYLHLFEVLLQDMLIFIYLLEIFHLLL